MELTYRTNVPLLAAEVATLFRSSGIRRPVDDPKRIQRMIDHANLTLTAWDGETLVGIARAVTDFSYCCYLSDLAVHRAYQRKGIGQELIRQLRERLGDEVMLLLLAAPEAMEYYPQIGFEKADNAVAHLAREMNQCWTMEGGKPYEKAQLLLGQHLNSGGCSLAAGQLLRYSLLETLLALALDWARLVDGTGSDG